ncbi:MAG: cysteine desulfurase [bacterium]|nr:MAG: cysteine desulfurase [bacterium]
MEVYLDYQSSKPVDPRVVEAMVPFFHENFGNPSSLHTEGDAATEALTHSRETIAGLIHADGDEIVFTSGATESNNLAIIGYALRNKKKGDHIIVSEVDHISVHNIAKYLEKNGFTVSKVPVDRYGRIHLQKLADRVTDRTILVSVCYASNEIGTVQPVAEIGAYCRERGIAFHTDAVAAEGLLSLDPAQDGIDLMTLSSNDIYGPKGLGVLFVRKGVRLSPLVIGGGQERGLRSGTENIPAIAGMAKAVEILHEEMTDEVGRFTLFRDRLIEEIPSRIPRCYLNGHTKERLPNNAHFRFDGIEGEALLLRLKAAGISASTGSACTSKTLEPSHTLIATGLLHEEAHGSLELTCGRFTTDTEINYVLDTLPGVVEGLRKLSPLYKE